MKVHPNSIIGSQVDRAWETNRSPHGESWKNKKEKSVKTRHWIKNWRNSVLCLLMGTACVVDLASLKRIQIGFILRGRFRISRLNLSTRFENASLGHHFPGAAAPLSNSPTTFSQFTSAAGERRSLKRKKEMKILNSLVSLRVMKTRRRMWWINSPLLSEIHPKDPISKKKW